MIKNFQIENYLYMLDQQLGAKSEKDKNMMFVLIFASLFAISYLLFWESSEQSYIESDAKASKIQADLDADNGYLSTNPPERVRQLDDEIANLNKQYLNYIQYNTYIKNQLEQISSLYYDPIVWGNYLNSVSTYAKAYNIKLTRFGNILKIDENSSFGHLLDIQIASEGGYKDTLKFINALEESFLVVDLHDFNITATDKVRSDLNISVWGIMR